MSEHDDHNGAQVFHRVLKTPNAHGIRAVAGHANYEDIP
jgi:hypothetical protein